MAEAEGLGEGPEQREEEGRVCLCRSGRSSQERRLGSPECQTLEQPGPFLWASGGGLVRTILLEAAGGFRLAVWGCCTALVPRSTLEA